MKPRQFLVLNYDDVGILKPINKDILVDHLGRLYQADGSYSKLLRVPRPVKELCARERLLIRVDFLQLSMFFARSVRPEWN